MSKQIWLWTFNVMYVVYEVKKIFSLRLRWLYFSALPGTARKEFKVEGGDHYPYHCQFKGCDKGFRKESLLQYHMKYYHTPDGGVVAVPPMRKRKKTTSVCEHAFVFI